MPIKTTEHRAQKEEQDARGLRPLAEILFAKVPNIERSNVTMSDQVMDERLLRVDSQRRLLELLALTHSEPPAVFWGVLSRWWAVCDDTWPYRGWLLDRMRGTKEHRPALSLAGPVPIYRGCSRARARGVSWTTDRVVALRFARGHRGIPVPEPVIAQALIEPEGVFLAIDDRNEHELLVDPRRLRSLRVGSAATA